MSRIVFGLSAGILGGLTNVMAPVLIIYSLESKYSKSDIIQASNLCFLLGKIIQLLLFATHGRFRLKELSISLVVLFFVLMALYTGVRIKRKIKVDMYQRLLRGFLLILSVTLLLKGIF